MKYALLIYDDPAAAPADRAEDETLMAEYGAFTREITGSGECVGGERLHGVDTATSVRVRKGRTAATDGPFAETKEHLGGFYLIDVLDLDHAIELAARIPGARTGVIEIRPVFPADD
jgi:hypothetical protein